MIQTFLLFPWVLPLAGCHGSSESRCDLGSSDVCPDGGASGDSGWTSRPGDELRVFELPDESYGNLLVDSLICLGARVVHEDGSMEELAFDAASVHLEVDDPGIAVAAPWDDCRDANSPAGGPGLIGVGAGTTRATIVYDGGGTTLTGTLGLEVFPYRLELEDSFTTTLPQGSTEVLGGRTLARDGDVEVTWRTAGRTIAPSLFRFDVTDPSVADVIRNETQPDAGWGFLLEAQRMGSTALTIRYGHETAGEVLGPIPITVTERGTLQSILSINYALEARSTSLTGYCYRSTAQGYFARTTAGNYVAALTEGVRWEALGPELTLEEDSAQALFCPTHEGETEIRACAGTICREGAIAHFAEGSVDRLELSPGSVTVIARPDPDGSGVQPVCVSIRADLVGPSGERTDVTLSPALAMRGETPGYLLEPLQTPEGRIETDASGAPCFFFMRDNFCATDPEASLTLTAQYGGPIPRTYDLIDTASLLIQGLETPPLCN